jgi:ankyrin repeat protein
MTAARTGSVPAIKALHAGGANINASESWRGQTALMWAVSENHPDAVRVLIEGGAAVNARTLVPTTPFTGGNEALLPATYNPSAGGFTPLLFAVRAGHLEMARTLLDSGASVNDALPSGMSALVLAVQNAHYELAAMLLERGANANADGQGWTALHQLVWARNPNRHFNLPPPILTGGMSDLDLAKALLAHGADINARVKREPRDGYRNWMNRVGATPYVLAAKAADATLMRFLLANAADPHLKAEDNTTALMAASGIGFWPAESPGTEAQALEAATLAFEQGDDVNAANENGYTALHGTAVRGANSIVRFLVGHGAKLDAKTRREGWTPLAIAEGVFIANTFKFMPATADLLRQLMNADKSTAIATPK